MLLSISMLDEKVLEALQFVLTYAPQITEWKVLKRELLNNLPIEKRKLFSKRDQKTKKQNFNEFERKISDLWQELTNTTLIITNNENQEQ